MKQIDIKRFFQLSVLLAAVFFITACSIFGGDEAEYKYLESQKSQALKFPADLKAPEQSRNFEIPEVSAVLKAKEYDARELLIPLPLPESIKKEEAEAAEVEAKKKAEAEAAEEKK